MNQDSVDKNFNKKQQECNEKLGLFMRPDILLG